MGLFNKILGGSDGGARCEPNAEGGSHCVIFDDDKKASGTDVNIIASRETNCEPIVVGDVMDKDRKKINELAEQHKQMCRRGVR